MHISSAENYFKLNIDQETNPSILKDYIMIFIFQDPAELGVQPKGPGITYADPQLSRVKTSKDPVAPPPRWLTTVLFKFHNFSLKFKPLLMWLTTIFYIS